MKKIILLLGMFAGATASEHQMLLQACSKGDLQGVKIALRAGADIEARDGSQNKITPLMVAAAHGHADVVQFLIDRGAFVDAQDSLRQSALMHAVLRGDTKITQVLLASGADVYLESGAGNTLFHYPVTHGQAMYRLLNDARLLSAAKNGDSDDLEMRLEDEADINACDRAGRTALMLSAKKGHTHLVKLLIARKADLLKTDKKGRTALEHAARKGNVDCLKLLLLQQDYRVQIHDLLLPAAIARHTELVKMLLYDSNGYSLHPEIQKNKDHLLKSFVHALIYVQKNSYNCLLMGVIKVLYDAGARLPAHESKTVLILLLQKEKYDYVADFLKNDLADVAWIDDHGMTALMWACKTNAPRAIAKMIVDYGPQEYLHKKDYHGYNALMHAVAHHHYEAAAFLVSIGADSQSIDLRAMIRGQ